jgi:hypothetical protein
VCQLFEDIEGRGAKMEQVIATFKHLLEEPINKEIIQEFTEKKALVQQQVKAARDKIEDFEVELPRPE